MERLEEVFREVLDRTRDLRAERLERDQNGFIEGFRPREGVFVFGIDLGFRVSMTSGFL